MESDFEKNVQFVNRQIDTDFIEIISSLMFFVDDHSLFVWILYLTISKIRLSSFSLVGNDFKI